ncbi:MAG: WD40/YVTN/BNR-like repeat-containing protein, partial [Syntrophobacteraceae bacterium]
MRRRRNSCCVAGLLIGACAILVIGCINAEAGRWTRHDTMVTRIQYSSVWGTSGSDVYAVGDKGAIVHYDGKSWSYMTSGTTQNLHSVWGSSESDVFAAGEAGTILHYDGKSWSAMTSGTTQNLHSVWGSSGADVFAVGGHGAIIHYDGKS